MCSNDHKFLKKHMKIWYNNYPMLSIKNICNNDNKSLTLQETEMVQYLP